MDEAERSIELRRLFNRLFDLYESRHIKDEDTAVTLAMLDHDMCIHEQLITSVKEMKECIEYGRTHSIPMSMNYITMYELFEKKMDTKST
jgi:hypothetical protein